MYSNTFMSGSESFIPVPVGNLNTLGYVRCTARMNSQFLVSSVPAHSAAPPDWSFLDKPKNKMNLKGQYHQKVCEIMIWSKLRFANSFLKL
jgi:hypothetical protein